MSTVTSQAPSVTTSSFKRAQIDVEPDAAWKQGLRKRIEEGLQSMVDDAKRVRDEDLARLPSGSTHRTRVHSDYNDAMANIIGLAEEQFHVEVERERQERRWQNGEAMLPQWDTALKSEQQEIMDRIKEQQKDGTSPAIITASTSFGPASFHSEDRPHHSRSASTQSTDPHPDSTRRDLERKPTVDRRSPNGLRSPGGKVGPSVDTTSEAFPATRPLDVRPPVFGNPEVLPKNLPSALVEKAEKVFGFDRDRDHGHASASTQTGLSRRGSLQHRDDIAHSSSTVRTAYFQSIPDRAEPIQLPSVNDSDDEEDKVSRPPERRGSVRKSSVHDRPVDVPLSRSIERQSRPPPERYTPRSPSGPPQIWKPSVLPEDDTSTPRSQTSLARRGSATSIRSNGSGSVRPTITEAIPERVDSESESQGPGGSEVSSQTRTTSSSGRDKGKQSPPRRSEGRFTPPSDPSYTYDEPTSYSSPRNTGGGGGGGGGHRPEPHGSSARPVLRKSSVTFEDRDHPPAPWLRSKPSFTNEDRGYSSYHPSVRPGSRAATDDRDHHHYEYRPYPSPPASSREYPPYSSGYDSRTESPYQSEQRSATWRAATVPPPQDSPPKRRPSESRPPFMREHSYPKFGYAPPEDEYPTQYDDYHNEKYLSKYAPPSSAIPISRPRKPPRNDEAEWKSWGPDPPLYRRGTQRESRRGHDYYDYDRDHEYRGRDERDYDYSARYRPAPYNPDVGPSHRDIAYGPRSPPSSYRDRSDMHHRLEARERGQRHAVEDEDEQESEDDEWWKKGKRRAEESSWAMPEVRREDSDGQPGTPDNDREDEFFEDEEDAVEETEGKVDDEEAERELELKRLELQEKLALEARRSEEEAARYREEAERQREEAERYREEAERYRQEAEKQREEAERQRVEAERQKEEATRQREEARMSVQSATKKEEEAKKLEAEIRRKEREAQRQEAEAKAKAEENLRREKEIGERLEEVRVKEQEAKRKEQEAKKKEVEAKLKEVEAKRKEDEAKKKEEEAKRKEEVLKKKEEEARKKEQEAKRKEQEVKRKEELARKKEEEVKKKEEEARKKEEQAKKKEEEVKRKEEEARKKEEETRKKEQEVKRKEEEARKKEQEVRRKEEEAKKKEEEVKQKEEEARKKEEEVKKKEEEARKREAEAQQKHEEARRKEEEIRQREEELRKREEELKRRETEMLDRTEAEKLQRQWDEEERQRRDKETQERLEEERRQEEVRNKEQEHEQERRRHPAKDPERLEQERLQQEEFRKREEQIRRQKRQESMNADVWGSPPSTFPSSPPPPTQPSSPPPPPPTTSSHPMGRSADRNPTPAPSWTSWASQAKANATAAASHASPQSPPPSSKPRSGSINSSSFPSSTSFSSAAFSSVPTAKEEAEWKRRQDEHFAKQQEQFRKEQERLENARQSQEARQSWTKEEYIATFETHNRQWNEIHKKAELHWRDFPWPMFKTPLKPEDIKMATIKAYVENDYYHDAAKDKEVKNRVRDLIKKWHPDRFERQYLGRVVEDERTMVGEGAGSVARALGEILSLVSR